MKLLVMSRMKGERDRYRHRAAISPSPFSFFFSL
jgi:hypothetical protein